MTRSPTIPPDIPALLAGGMGPGLHWFPADVAAARLAGVLVGMANVQGGMVLIGIAPRSGHIQGVGDTDEVLDVIFQAALLSDPPLVLPIPRVVEVGAQKILSITVPPGLPNVYSLEGRYLGREGTQTNPLPARRLRQLLVERGVVQFESQLPPGATVEDLDREQVAEYIAALDLPGAETWEAQLEVLHRRGCLKRVGEGLCPTYAALLLFGQHPQQWLPNATILAARFTGISFADRFLKQDISGTLPEQLRRAEAFARENLRRVVRVVGLKHQETTEYPLEAVRELLVNAVAHRDYNQQGDTIHLNFFSDRIEVQSPGALPGPVNLENLLEARFSRNAVIVQVLSDLGFVERLGYGLDRVVTVMRQNSLRQPRFDETAGSFRVTLYGDPQATLEKFPGLAGEAAGEQTVPYRRREMERALPDLAAFRDLGLNPRQELALGHVAQNRRITNRDYQELCPDVHPETLRRDLADLVGRGILIKVGDKKATYYIFK